MKTISLFSKAVVIILCSYLFIKNNLNAQSENILYGVTKGGGTYNAGIIFHIDCNTGKQTVDYSMPVIISGKNSSSDLTDGGNGKFYGMTSGGGSNGYGVIFEWDPVDNNYTKKIDFDSLERGRYPSGSLTLSGGKFYGMTTYGGTNDVGVIFEWDPITNIFTKKMDFDETANGSSPLGSLTLSEDRLYGMTPYGGKDGGGIIFEWDPVTNIFIKKIDFDGPTTGYMPHGSLALNSGKFYGMTPYNGLNGCGTIFEWDPSTNVITKKIDFGGTNGGNPGGSLTLSGGKFYGMTSSFGENDVGVIFEWDPVTNIFTKKIDFDAVTKGKWPWGSLILSGGKFYGMTSMGGIGNYGVIFEWDPVTNIFIKKIDFDGLTVGSKPQGSLALKSGKLYGMTKLGGIGNAGVIFEWDPTNNTYTKKIDFEEAPNGRFPYNSLTLSGGKLYGMTYEGGAYNAGVIFEWNPLTNSCNKKIDFDGTNGRNPSGTLTLKDGKFYGMTNTGGTSNNGIIFEWDPATNTYTKKIDLDGKSVHKPFGSLTLNNGKLYGMALGDGASNNGVIFEWDPTTNIFIKKIDIEGSMGSNSFPGGFLTFSGGKCYGRTYDGPFSHGYFLGFIFEWDPITNIFTKKIDIKGSLRDAWPNGSLTLKSGKLYGMTSEGGANMKGSIFEWNPIYNIYIDKIDLDYSSTGGNPQGSLTSNGEKFFGMTTLGGAFNKGVIFEWDPITNAYNKLMDFNGINGSSPWYTQLTPYSIEVPFTQATNISFTNVQTNQIAISWTNGNGSKRAVFVKEGTGPISNPTDNTTFAASTNWTTKGSQLGTSGYYCVYNGSGDSMILTGLATHTLYTIQVFEYNGIPGTELYQTSTSINNPAIRQTATSTPVTSAGIVTVCQGDMITIPVTVNDLTSVSAISLRMDYDPQLMTYSSYSNINPEFTNVIISDVMVSATLHKIIFVWSDINPVTLTNGSKLVDLNFTYLSGSPILIFNNTDNGSGDCEYVDEYKNPFIDSPTASFYSDGQVTLNPGLPAGVSIAVSNNPVCAGTSVLYTAIPVNEGTIPSYQWKVNGGNAGTNDLIYSYLPENGDVVTCVMTSNLNCVTGSPAASNAIAMTVNTIPTDVSASANPNPIYENATLTLTGSATGATSWSWIGPNSFSSALQDPEIANITISDAGEYTLTASNSCGAAAIVNTELVIVNSVGFEELKGASIKLYPNPTNEIITFIYQTVSNQRLKDLDLYNSIGIKVKSFLKDKNEAELYQQFNLQPIQNGTYFLVIRTQDQYYVVHLSIFNK